MSMVVVGASFLDVKGYPLAKFIPTGRNAGSVEYIHGGVARNIAEDVANVGLRPVFVSLVDTSAVGQDMIRRLADAGTDTRFMRAVDDGMGTWVAVFDPNGDVYASVSKRPDLTKLSDVLAEKGDEIFASADSVLIETDIEEAVVSRVFDLARFHNIPVFGAVSNISIALERRQYLKKMGCFVCNRQEAEKLFSEIYQSLTPDQMADVLLNRIRAAGIPAMVVTMGEYGAAYASVSGEKGICAAEHIPVRDTTGAGDAFFAGVSIGLTYGKTLAQSCRIGTRLAASVISSLSNVCPRFQPAEFGIDYPGRD